MESAVSTHPHQPHDPASISAPVDEPIGMSPLDRRTALRLGLVLGAGAILSGCSSSRSSRRGTPMTPVGSSSSRTGTASTGSTPAQQPPEFVSHRPAWLDEWKNGQQSLSVSYEPRSAWTRTGPNPKLANPMRSVSRITVHHDGMTPFTTPSRDEAIRRIEAIRSAHVNQGWADIGYHYIIDPGGRVWQGRPSSLQGAHVKDQNEMNLGIMMLGNYNRQQCSVQSQMALQRVLADAMRTYRIPVSRVHTHTELASTACPGTDLQRYMDRVRSTALT